MPRQTTKAKTTRIEARISPLGLEMVRRAAEMQGRSISDFVVEAAEAAALKTIEDMHVIKLTLEAQDAFADAILNPPKPGPALRKARESHRRLVRESR